MDNPQERTENWANRFEDAAKELETKHQGTDDTMIMARVVAMKSIAVDLREQAKQFEGK